MADKIQIPFNIKNEAEIKRVLTNILTNMITNSESKTLKDLTDENKALILAIIKGAGLEIDGSYKTPENTYYLDSATSLKIADILLDSELKIANDNITQNAAGILDLQNRIIDVYESMAFTVNDVELNITPDSPITKSVVYDYDRHAISFTNDADLSDDYTIYMSVQIPRGYKLGTDIIPELYWIQEVPGDVVWNITYRIYHPGEAIPGWTTIASTGTKYTYSSGTLLQTSTFEAISGSAIVDTDVQIDIRISRNANNANDTLNGNAYFKSLLLWVCTDKLGIDSHA
jgi:hypothetical protein